MPSTTVIALLMLTSAVERKSVNICELVRHAEKYSNKLVTVTGDYMAGPHGATIALEQCGFQSRYPPFRSGAAIAVDRCDSSAKLPVAAKGLLDLHSIQHFDKAMEEALVRSQDADLDIPISVLGLIKVADHYTTQDSRDGGFEGTGYGFLGRYPAQITILRIVQYQITIPKSN